MSDTPLTSPERLQEYPAMTPPSPPKGAGSYPAHHSSSHTTSLPDREDIDLFEVLRLLALHSKTILLTALIMTALATTAAFLITPVYRAEVLAAPVSPERETGELASVAERFGGLAAMAGIDIGEQDMDVEAAIATLRSRAFTIDFIKDNALLPILFDDIWDPSTASWNVKRPEDVPTLWDAFHAFDEIRELKRDRATNLLTLSIQWKDPILAATWANKIVARVNQQRKQFAIDEATKTIDFLKQQLDSTHIVEIQQAIWSLIEAQTKKIMLASVRDEYAFAVLDPALPPDPDDYVKPQRLLIVSAGLTAGLLLGSLIVLVTRRPGTNLQ